MKKRQILGLRPNNPALSGSKTLIAIATRAIFNSPTATYFAGGDGLFAALEAKLEAATVRLLNAA